MAINRCFVYDNVLCYVAVTTFAPAPTTTFAPAPTTTFAPAPTTTFPIGNGKVFYFVPNNEQVVCSGGDVVLDFGCL